MRMTPANSGIKLTDRQRRVLSSIIQNFIVSAVPISSSAVTRDRNIQASSATIRNTMAQLEKMGLLEHQHTSSGRLPTDLGYRVYLNSMIDLQALQPQEKSIISRELENIKEEKEMLRLSTRVLSSLTDLMGIAAFSLIKDGTFEKVTLVSVSDKKVMLIISVSSGLVKSVIVELELDLNPGHLEQISSFLNEKLAGQPVSFLNNNYLRDIEKIADSKNSGSIKIFTRSILKLLKSSEETEVQIAGTKRIVNQPEFEKIEDIEGIIELLDDKKTLVHFLQSRGEHKGIHVTVGKEHKLGLFQTHSAITSTFNVGAVKGTVGIIGPTRMEYSKLISLVDFTAKVLSRRVENEN